MISRAGIGVIQFDGSGRFATTTPLRSDFDASQLRAVARKTKNDPQALLAGIETLREMIKDQRDRTNSNLSGA